MRYVVLFLAALFFSTNSLAFTCFLTMVKAPCWKPYALNVELSDAQTGKLIRTTKVAENQLWVRDKFECKPGATLAMEATFSPVFWASDVGRIFKGLRYWKLPDTIIINKKIHETGWNVTVCYPTEFSDVPQPPSSNTNCDCDYSTIPPVKPQKLP